MMNRVVNALNGPVDRALLAGTARRGFSIGPAPGRALRLLAVLPYSSRIFPHDFFAAPEPDLYSQVVDNQPPCFYPFSVEVREAGASPEAGGICRGVPDVGFGLAKALGRCQLRTAC